MVGLLVACFLLLGANTSSNALTITSATQDQLVSNLLGTGIDLVSGSIGYTGSSSASGIFSGGSASDLGLDSGIVLTTGLASDADGPNTNGSETLSGGGTDDDASTDLSLSGDSDLTNLAGYSTYDASILEFDFITSTGDLYFNYIFASEEYIDYVNTAYNDVFGFYVDGVNIALVPGTSNPVTINTVNPETNSAYYINNVTNTNGYSVAGADTKYDGFTTIFMAQILDIGAGAHTMKLAIADGSDGILDAAVFLEEGSFSGNNPVVPEPSTILLMGIGLIGLLGYGRKRSQKG